MNTYYLQGCQQADYMKVVLSKIYHNLITYAVLHPHMNSILWCQASTTKKVKSEYLLIAIFATVDFFRIFELSYSVGNFS